MAARRPAPPGFPCAAERATCNRGPGHRSDLRPRAVLQRVLRGSDDLGAHRPAGARITRARTSRRARRAAGRGAGGGAGLIEQWRKALVLAPHTDDGEFGCGGTMARLVEAGCDVRYVAFSIATRSLPPGFPPGTLAQEVREATAELGIPAESLTVHDVHQDHRTVAEEGLRAFKRTTILGYEIPWNNFDFEYQWYVALEGRHVV